MVECEDRVLREWRAVASIKSSNDESDVTIPRRRRTALKVARGSAFVRAWSSSEHAWRRARHLEEAARRSFAFRSAAGSRVAAPPLIPGRDVRGGAETAPGR
eukprot:CAMPEP_0180137698 /NCGR_PEP_ID=MMETSP0986-20121125/12397_1 /TAXON_ID=697907 /ORGANISM="non described non described, Strain CCMP2293" /LENGTH=101 /DNA_ID=CAMNT_0022079269 /DNA_START=380 /DNA_END=686 /DNA_ORIENTATION=-